MTREEQLDKIAVDLFPFLATPLKIFTMEPKNHPIEKEHHLNQTSIFGFHVSFSW